MYDNNVVKFVEPVFPIKYKITTKFFYGYDCINYDHKYLVKESYINEYTSWVDLPIRQDLSFSYNYCFAYGIIDNQS